MLNAAGDGSVSIFFNNIKKVETTNQGILVQGITTSTHGFEGGTSAGVAGITTLAPSGGITLSLIHI